MAQLVPVRPEPAAADLFLAQAMLADLVPVSTEQAVRPYRVPTAW